MAAGAAVSSGHGEGAELPSRAASCGSRSSLPLLGTSHSPRGAHAADWYLHTALPRLPPALGAVHPGGLHAVALQPDPKLAPPLAQKAVWAQGRLVSGVQPQGSWEAAMTDQAHSELQEGSGVMRALLVLLQFR